MATELNNHVISHADTLIKELHSEMRSIRDADLKMIPFFFTICAFILSGNLITILNAEVEIPTVLGVAIPSLAFVALFWSQLHWLIEYNNGKYRELGGRVQEIWKLWEVSQFCDPDQRFGSGSGYKKTQRLLASSALAVIVIVVAMILLKLK